MHTASLLTMIAVLIATSACGSLRVSPVTSATPPPVTMAEDGDLGLVYLAPGFAFPKYDTLVVREPALGSALPIKDIEPEQMTVYLKMALIKQLLATGLFARVTDDRAVLEERSGKVLVLESTFAELDPGSRALRYFVGMGAGRTKVQVESEIKDVATRDLVFKASDRRVGWIGGFGGDSQSFILESIDDIAKGHAKFIKRVSAGGSAPK